MLSIAEYVMALLDEPYKKLITMIDQYDERLQKFQEERPEVLSAYKAHMSKLTNFKTALDSIKFDLSLDVVLAVITDELAKEQEKWLSDKEATYSAVDEQITSLKNEIESSNKLHNQCLINQNNDGNADFRMLEEKRKSLEEYSDKIFNVCNQYGITTSDIAIDETMFTPNELSSLYDEYIAYMQKESTGTNVIAKFRKVCDDSMMQGIVLIGMLIACFTPILDFVSIAFFTALGVNQIQNINRVKFYSILLAITFNVKPENMGFTALDESQLLPEELTDEMLDKDERFSKFESMYDEVEAKFEESNPDTRNSKVIAAWSDALPENQKHLKELETTFNNKIERIKADVIAEIAYMNKQYEKLKSEYKFLGDRFSQHLTFNGTFTLGIHDDCIEETVDVGQRNIVIRPSVDTSKMNKFLQAMYVNAVSNVSPGKVKVIVYDPNDFGRSIMPLFKNEINQYLEFYNDDLTKIIDDLVTYVQENFKAMSGKTIDEYNKKCEEVGMTPIEYRILMVLSQPKTIEEDEKLQSFFEYSATGGVFIWMISDYMQSKTAFVFRRPFESIEHPITDIVNDDWCAKVASNYADAISKSKPKGLPWKEFIDNVIPDSKMWTGNADNYMELYPGYLNGDPTSYKPFEVGNTGNVHVIGVGGTGAGKSVFLNHLIATATKEYSPRELELWLTDFKGTEFKFYLPNDECPYMLPHIKACLCTSDGDYATSLFHALRVEADHRYDVLKDPSLYVSELAYCPDGKTSPNQKGAVGWNKFWRQKASDTGDERYTENCWPRILFIADEFQVIFEKADPKNLDLIKADITQIAKVGRAANVHIFFTSQSMKKTLSADILQQFTLRFALRCDKEVSQEILGTSKASDIKEKFGFLIVKATGISNEDQPRYRTPFIPDDDLREHIKRMALLAEERKMPKKDVITYEEVTKHPIQQLVDTYNSPAVKKSLPDSGVFFLGNRMAYSQNKAPDNIILTAKNNTNIMSVLSDYTDFVMFFQELMCNIKNNKVPGTVIINTQVHDLGYLCDIDNCITFPDKHGHLLYENNKPKEIVKWIQGLYNARKEKGRKDTPIWIFLLGWDKGPGFGIETDMNVRTNMNNLLQTCGEYNIHIIFMGTTMTGMALATVNACNYRIAAKCSVDDSDKCIGTRQAGKNYEGMKTGWIFSWHDGNITRDKLYISECEREIASSEIVL
jgi:hypothetical protein